MLLKSAVVVLVCFVLHVRCIKNSRGVTEEIENGVQFILGSISEKLSNFQNETLRTFEEIEHVGDIATNKIYTIASNAKQAIKDIEQLVVDQGKDPTRCIGTVYEDLVIVKIKSLVDLNSLLYNK